MASVFTLTLVRRGVANTSGPQVESHVALLRLAVLQVVLWLEHRGPWSAVRRPTSVGGGVGGVGGVGVGGVSSIARRPSSVFRRPSSFVVVVVVVVDICRLSSVVNLPSSALGGVGGVGGVVRVPSTIARRPPRFALRVEPERRARGARAGDWRPLAPKPRRASLAPRLGLQGAALACQLGTEWRRRVGLRRRSIRVAHPDSPHTCKRPRNRNKLLHTFWDAWPLEQVLARVMGACPDGWRA